MKQWEQYITTCNSTNKLRDIILSKNTPTDFICFSTLKTKLTYTDRNQKQGIMNEKTHEVMNDDDVLFLDLVLYTQICQVCENA